jgi:hypothetical protein
MTVLRRLGAKTGTTMLTGALAIGAALALPGTANAGVGVCSLSGPSGSCSIVGSVTLTGGALTMVAPVTLTWTAGITGTAQTVYDTLATDDALDVLDLRGLLSSSSTSGWDVTATATAFTGTVTKATIPDSTTGKVLAFGGGSTSATATSVPSALCLTAGTCTVATDTVAGYPLFIPTGATATPVKIFNATAGTGTGIVQIGTSAVATGTNPAVWSVTLPSSVAADIYTSTITVTVAAGP